VVSKKQHTSTQVSQRYGTNVPRRKESLKPWKSIIIREHDLLLSDLKYLKNSYFFYGDTETNGLDYRKHTLLQFQFCNDKKEVFIVRRPNHESKNLIELFITKRWTFHHIGFDLRFIINDLLRDKILTYPHCTKILSKLLDPNESSSLAKVVERYLGYKMTKGQALSNWATKKLTKSQIEYAAYDVIYLKELEESMLNKLSTFDDSQLYRNDSKRALYTQAIQTSSDLAFFDVIGRGDLLVYDNISEQCKQQATDWAIKTGKVRPL
jgi:ribonuclease D